MGQSWLLWRPHKSTRSDLVQAEWRGSYQKHNSSYAPLQSFRSPTGQIESRYTITPSFARVRERQGNSCTHMIPSRQQPSLQQRAERPATANSLCFVWRQP